MSLYSTQQVLCSLSSSWLGGEPWLRAAAVEMSELYRELRKDIRDNKNVWSYPQYCERLAYHYYNLASFYNQLYCKNKVDLDSVRKWLEVCLEQLEEIPQQYCSKDTAILKSDAENCLSDVQLMYKTQVGRCHIEELGNENQLLKCANRYIALGNIADCQAYLRQLDSRCVGRQTKSLERQIQNVQVLRTINILEDALTVPIEKDVLITAEQSDCLSQAYNLIGELVLCNRYKNTAKHLILKHFKSDTKEHSQVGSKQLIRDIIRRNVDEYASTLQGVKHIIEKENAKSLSNTDLAYTELKYVNYCLESWLQEAICFVKELCCNEYNDIIQYILNALDSIEGLKQISEPLNQRKYYNLLMKHYDHVSPAVERDFIRKFKHECLKQIVTYTGSVKNKLTFLKAFVAFLYPILNNESIITDLQLKDFCDGTLPFEQFLTKIMTLQTRPNNGNLLTLQKAAELLIGKNDLFLMSKIREIICKYIRPVEIQEMMLDGRAIVKVTGKCIFISEIVHQLENKLSETPAIEEVRFVASHATHIDTDLTNSVWHGKNIVVLTEAVTISGKVCWDVSGHDNSHEYSNIADTGEDGHGKPGAAGYPGESGGNVLILAEEMDHPEQFTIISHGGKGGRGQDGGNGTDGEDGDCIDEMEFNKKFCYESNLFRSTRTLYTVERILKNILKDSSKVKTVWYSGRSSATIGDILGDIGVIRFHHQRNIPDDMFIETIENDKDTKIYFSFHGRGSRNGSQFFLLYKGTPGRPRGYGGMHGLGGEGGFAGQVTVKSQITGQEYNVIKETVNGEKGENGRDGVHGDKGRNDLDRGYLNHDDWENVLESKNGKYVVKYYTSSSNDRVWCPYRKMYAGIVPANDENERLTGCEERNDVILCRDRQHHAHATRKKNIFQEHISDNYLSHFYFIEKDSLQTLESHIESIKQKVVQGIKENEVQVKKQNLNLNIHRQISSIHHSTKNSHETAFSRTPTTISTDTTEQETELLIRDIHNNPLLQDNWIKLKSCFLGQLQLDQLFAILYSQNDQEYEAFQGVEQILIEKYRFAIYHDVVTELSSAHAVTEEIETTPEIEEKCLFQSEEFDNNVYHDALGCINKFLYHDSKKDREIISKFCKEELGKATSEALRQSVRVFVLRQRQAYNAHSDFKKYYDEYQRFLEKERPGFVPSPVARIDQECCANRYIFEEYIKHIEEEGASSESYRELLANAYDISIRVYAESQEKQLSFVNHHNSSSEKSVHILCRDNRFIQLRINKDYLRLVEERRKSDKIYKWILDETEYCKEKQDFDDFMKKLLCSTDTHHYKGEIVNEQPSGEVNLNEEELVSKIIEYFPNKEEKQKLKERLNKIGGQYIRKPGILQIINRRFSNEGSCVTSQELCVLVNSFLGSFVHDKQELNLFRWIVAIFPQRNWIDELLILKLEEHFKKPLENKSKWREHLSKIGNKDILISLHVKLDKYSTKASIQFIEEIVILLSHFPTDRVNLEGLEVLKWTYALKDQYWLYKLSKLANWQETEDLLRASYHLMSIENRFGTLLAEELLRVLERKNLNLPPYILIEIFSNFYTEKWNLSLEQLSDINSCNNNEFLSKMKRIFNVYKDERDVEQLVKLINNNSNTSERFIRRLTRIENVLLSDNKDVTNFSEKDIKDWVHRKTMNDIKRIVEGNYMDVLAVVDKAIELRRGFKLRETQRLTVLALLTYKQNVLAQVCTGEGKSLIVVTMAIIKALCGEQVDIITNSPVLAKRDAEEYRDIYKLFNITVAHNCSEDIEKRKEVYSCNQVVYGDLSQFQRDWLIDKFYEKNILGDHKFENIIIDEVDCMLLDKGNNTLYLSHDIPGMDKLVPVYMYIWQWISRPARSHEELSYAFDTKEIEKAVLYNIYGIITKEDIQTLDSSLSQGQIDVVFNCLVERNIIDKLGRLQDDIIDGKLVNLLPPDLVHYEARLQYLLNECLNREKFIIVPNYLKRFVAQHLGSWIQNAITAFLMKDGQDYVVDVDRTGTSPDCNPNITILDRDTGTDQANSQWDEALHQFLQLKHGCKLSMLSLQAVFISNIAFLKLFRNLYGLTGTLGSQRERDLLTYLHGVDFITIPTAKAKQFNECKPILCSSRKEWTTCIFNETDKLICEEKRSVLIICETVGDVEVINKAFAEKGTSHVLTYTRDYEKFNAGLGSHEFDQGQVIIATNLAGRGTNIKITDALRRAGGLHVCLTYLPRNIRIEEQAFGRTARCGERGSGQLIIWEDGGEVNEISKIIYLKKQRDAEEFQCIADTKEYYNTQITVEENCFKMFKEQYKLLKDKLEKGLKSQGVQELKELLLQSSLERWAMWLDRNNNTIRNHQNEQSKSDLHNSLNEVLSSFKTLRCESKEDWFDWVKENPFQMIKLAKYFCITQEYDMAIRLFDKVIKQEPKFCEAAHYYKAFALTKKSSFDKDNKLGIEFMNELRESARLFNQHIKFATSAASVVASIKDINPKNIIQIDSFEKQQQSLAKLYHIFVESINDICGHNITPHTFVNMDVNEELAQTLYDELIRRDYLTGPGIARNFPKENLQRVCFGYGMSVKTLDDFLSANKNNGNMNEKQFLKKIKEFKLPSKELFWKLLIEARVLHREVQYIVLDEEEMKKLKNIDRSYLEKLTSCSLEAGNKQILFYTKPSTQQHLCSFERSYFLRVVGRDKYKVLKRKGILSCNKKAHVNTSKLDHMMFPCYDSLRLQDFSKVNIIESEAKLVVNELIKEKVIQEKANGEYGLRIMFDKVKRIQLPSFQVYEHSVKALLALCFAYRIALQRITTQLKERSFPVQIKLPSRPHYNLFFDLIEENIVTPTRVTSKVKNSKDFKEVLNRMKITKDTSAQIANTLEQLVIPLDIKETSDFHLNSLVEEQEITNIQEVFVVSLNGLGQLLKIRENKWTFRMCIYTTVVLAMGVIQITVNALKTLRSVGCMTHLGSALVREGVSDMFFAVGAASSRYYSWKTHFELELESLKYTAITVGLGTLVSRGAKFSHYGYKVAGPNYENVIKIAEASGTQMRNEVRKRLGTEVAKYITLNTVTEVMFGLSDAGVDVLGDNYFQQLLAGIESHVILNIEQEVEKHKISLFLGKVCKMLGRQETKRIVGNFTNKFFISQTHLQQCVITFSKLADSVVGGFPEVIGKGNEKVTKMLKYIDKCIKAEPSTHIIELNCTASTFLDQLYEEIRWNLNIYDKRECLNPQREAYIIEGFENDVSSHLKVLLSKQVLEVLGQHFLKPILNAFVERWIENACRFYKDHRLDEQCKKSKQEYVNAQKTIEHHRIKVTQSENHITKQYHEILTKLIAKSTRPEASTDLIREGIPLDLACIDASTRIPAEQMNTKN